jgi:hypothetical protein
MDQPDAAAIADEEVMRALSDFVRRREGRSVEVRMAGDRCRCVSIQTQRRKFSLFQRYNDRRVRARRFAIVAVLAICLGGPVVEMFDRWDHTLQDDNDTEANVVIAALCVGVALSVAGVVVARVRAMSSDSDVHLFASARVRLTTAVAVPPNPASSPPTPLRV